MLKSDPRFDIDGFDDFLSLIAVHLEDLQGIYSPEVLKRVFEVSLQNINIDVRACLKKIGTEYPELLRHWSIREIVKVGEDFGHINTLTRELVYEDTVVGFPFFDLVRFSDGNDLGEILLSRLTAIFYTLLLDFSFLQEKSHQLFIIKERRESVRVREMKRMQLAQLICGDSELSNLLEKHGKDLSLHQSATLIH